MEQMPPLPSLEFIQSSIDQEGLLGSWVMTSPTLFCCCNVPGCVDHSHSQVPLIHFLTAGFPTLLCSLGSPGISDPAMEGAREPCAWRKLLETESWAWWGLTAVLRGTPAPMHTASPVRITLHDLEQLRGEIVSEVNDEPVEVMDTEE